MHRYGCLLTGILILFVGPLMACDLCSTYLGINPNDYQNSFRLVHRLRVFESTFQAPSIGGNSGFSRLSHVNPSNGRNTSDPVDFREEFRTFDLWANIFINQRWQLSLMTSFSDHYKYQSDSLVNNVAGIGDLQTIVKYQLFNTKKSMDTAVFVQRLLLGGGVKLPTGSFNKRGMEEVLDPHLQAGTGSWDYLVMAEYLFRYYKWGLNTNLIYKINSNNKDDFRFANRFNWNTSLFYLQSIRKLKIMPSTGLALESGRRDTYLNENYLGSGGEAMFATVGLRLFYKNWSIGSTYFTKPMHEDLYDQSLQLENKYRVISELNYYF